jgi:hypothetical protein
MESLIGEDNMQTLLREWIDEKKQTSVNYKMFGQKFRDFISKAFDAEKAKEIDEKMQYEAWVLQPGLPPVHLDFTTKELNESSALAD